MNILSVISIILFCYPALSLAQNEIEDGIYDIEYEVLTAEADDVSIANDYFDKPATFIVDGDNRWIQFPINHAEWVVELTTPQNGDFTEVETLEEDEEADTRIIQFPVEEDHDLEEPIEINMHIIVDVLEEDYDHHYTTFFDFDEESITETDEPLVEVTDEDEKGDENQKTKFYWILSIFIGCIITILIILFIYRKRVKNNEEK